MDLVFTWGAPHGRLRARRADAFEQDGCGFVVGVLRDQLSFEGLLEDGLAEAGGAGGKRLTILGRAIGE